MHFYESSIITTKDGLHCQVYGNEHPVEGILVKPKYIPTDKISSDALSYRFISGKKMNRLNLWAEKEALKKYFEDFKKNYPHYIYKSPLHADESESKGESREERLFFNVPVDHIERIYFPRRGLTELMDMPKNSLDPHLNNVHEFVEFLLKSGLRLKDLGVTYSTLMGHYLSSFSDINIVVYGKQNFWRLMEYLKTAEHPLLRWKSRGEWLEFYAKRNRFAVFDKEQFVNDMERKKSEGYFNNTLFVIFAAEKEEETWFRWGEEKYEAVGEAKIEATVAENFSSVVRPGVYEIKDAKIIGLDKNKKIGQNIDSELKIKQVVFYSRDYCMLAYPNEKIIASGILEKVVPKDKNKKAYYRVVVGYFDAYTSERREREYIKVVNTNGVK